MKIIRTTFPDGTTINHKGEIESVIGLRASYDDDKKFEVEKKRAKELKEQADKANLYNPNNRNY